MKTETYAIGLALTARYPQLLPLHSLLNTAVEVLCDCHKRDGLILVCGNGGSAADAAHITGELLKGFRLARQPSPTQLSALQRNLEPAKLAEKMQQGVRAINLCESSAVLTAISNDLGAELVYAQQVFALGRPGDVLIGISTSGNAVNVVHALQTARSVGLHTLGLTGSNPGRMDSYCDLLFKVPEMETYKIQELHLPLYHALCGMIEAEIFA
jgi:D-sedoheptulose 7-phosphate isomerase